MYYFLAKNVRYDANNKLQSDTINNLFFSLTNQTQYAKSDYRGIMVNPSSENE